MNRYLPSGFATLAVTALLALAAASPAEARIECRGQFQVTKYGLISDAVLRGREYRTRCPELWRDVTGAQVRNNALKKVYLCQTLGDDSRMKGSCGAYAPDVYGR